MKELRQDLRAHPVVATTIAVAWGLLTWLVIAMELSMFGVALLLAPPFLAGFLIGRSRRLRAARASGFIAVLLIGVALFDLSILAINLAGRAGEGDPANTPWQEFQLAAFLTVLGDLFFVLPSSALGWLFGHEAVYPEEANAAAR